jgi:hypothetical protein
MKLGINWVWSHPKLSHNNLPMQVSSWLPRLQLCGAGSTYFNISSILGTLPIVHGMSFDDFYSTHAI